MSNQLEITIVEHKSPKYWLTIELRDAILRKPLGLEFSQEELLAENNQIHVAAWIGGKLVACLVLVPLSSNELKMRQVAVVTNMQGKGLGRKLAAFCETYGKEQGFELMSLHAREVASRFYLKLNYTIVGEPFEEVGLPHYRMEKVL